MYKLVLFIITLSLNTQLTAQPKNPFFKLNINKIKLKFKNLRIDSMSYNYNLKAKTIFLTKEKKPHHKNTINIPKVGGVAYIKKQKILFVYQKDTMELNIAEWRDSMLYYHLTIEKLCFKKGKNHLDINKEDNKSKNKNEFLINSIFCSCH